MKFNKHTLENGLRIITIPTKDSPAVTVLVMVEAGSKYETKDITGLSHFLEHMCFKGTTKRPKAIDISRELDSIGAQYNAFTSQEYTGYYAKSHPKHLDKTLDVISDMYLNPIFEEKEIEKEKGVIVEEIHMYEDMPHRHVQDVFTELLYGDQPAGWNIAGTVESVLSMTRDHFVDYRAKHYVASGTIVVVAGNFDEKETLEKIKKLFVFSQDKKFEKVPVVESQDAPRILIKEKKTDQTHLVIGVRAFDTHHKDIPTLRVLDAVLGGGMSARLFQKLRDEMGVGYYVRSNVDTSTDHGALFVSTGVDVKRVKEVVEAIITEFKKLRDEKVGEDELQKAKDCLTGNLYLDLESSDAIAGFYAMQDVMHEPIKTPDELSESLQKVTALDVQRVAREIFVNKGLNLALIGITEKEELEKALVL